MSDQNSEITSWFLTWLANLCFCYWFGIFSKKMPFRVGVPSVGNLPGDVSSVDRNDRVSTRSLAHPNWSELVSHTLRYRQIDRKFSGYRIETRKFNSAWQLFLKKGQINSKIKGFAPSEKISYFSIASKQGKDDTQKIEKSTVYLESRSIFRSIDFYDR